MLVYLHILVTARLGVYGLRRRRNAGVQYHDVEPREASPTTRKGPNRVVGRTIQLPDLDAAAPEISVPGELHHRCLASRLAPDGKDEGSDSQIEKLAAAFEADATVGPGHDGDLGLDRASRSVRWYCEDTDTK
ncbi:hypothetical protein PG996_012228 [Apiospora saccharicola]|uniref:Uncharacterized protein n=1 Tax=Apiospora saccharicola TaxID=335842 RepID=A0ABR1U2K2_9PEZI